MPMNLQQAAMVQPAPEQEAPPEEGQLLSEEEEMDLEITVRIAERLLSQGGYEVLAQAVEQSADPAQVMGTFLAQMMMQLHEGLPPEMEVSGNVYLAEGGWLDLVGDLIEETLGVEHQLIEDAKIYAAEDSMAAGTEPPPQEQAGAPQQMPAQPGPMMGGV